MPMIERIARICTILWSIDALGSRFSEKRRKPYVPILSSTAARITEPAVGASTCASGSQVWKGNMGTLMAKPMKKAQKTHCWVPSGRLSFINSAISKVPDQRAVGNGLYRYNDELQQYRAAHVQSVFRQVCGLQHRPGQAQHANAISRREPQARCQASHRGRSARVRRCHREQAGGAIADQAGGPVAQRPTPL